MKGDVVGLAEPGSVLDEVLDDVLDEVLVVPLKDLVDPGVIVPPEPPVGVPWNEAPPEETLVPVETFRGVELPVPLPDIYPCPFLLPITS